MIAAEGVQISMRSQISPRSFLLILAIFVANLLLSACAPTFSPEEVHATAQHLASTGIALTLTAMPSATLTPTETPLPPTNTPEPTLTPSEAASATATLFPTVVATVTPFGQLQPTDFGAAQDNKADKNAPLAIVNDSDESTVRFALLTPYYSEYEIGSGLSLILDEGEYSFRVWIGNTIVNGSFRITNGDKHVLTIRDDKTHFATP